MPRGTVFIGGAFLLPRNCDGGGRRELEEKVALAKEGNLGSSSGEAKASRERAAELLKLNQPLTLFFKERKGKEKGKD